jgi:uncharacterized iron-regulated membrane protein
MNNEPKQPFSVRRILLQVHLWVGLIFCIPFVILGVTGSYLVYDQDFMTVPRATAVGEVAAPSEIIAAVNRDGFRTASVTMPSEAGDPAIVRLARITNGEQQGPGRGFAGGAQVYVDPVSLEVIGDQERNRTALSDFMHQLHGSLLIGGREGRSVVGWLGVGMTLLGITGLVLWWPKGGAWRNAFGVRRDAKGYPFHRQLHGATGIWGWVVFIIVSFSGVAISFPATIGPAMHSMLGGQPLPPVNQEIMPVEGQATIAVDEAVAIALAEQPGSRVVGVFLPGEPEGAMRVTVLATDAVKGTPATSISIDPYRGEVASVRNPQEGLGNAFMAWQRPLHDGQGLGMIWQFLVFASGLMPVLFTITGTIMWWIKRRNKIAMRVRKQAALEGAPAE